MTNSARQISQTPPEPENNTPAPSFPSSRLAGTKAVLLVLCGSAFLLNSIFHPVTESLYYWWLGPADAGSFLAALLLCTRYTAWARFLMACCLFFESVATGYLIIHQFFYNELLSFSGIFLLMLLLGRFLVMQKILALEKILPGSPAASRVRIRGCR